MATASPQQRVLATAASQIGYSRHTDPKNGSKYARETQPVFWPRDLWLLANGISFCDIWVTWVFWKALGKDFVTSGALPAGASFNTDFRASKGGRVSKPPRPGDVLVFDWNWATPSTNHVAILERVLPSGNYQTIEGNTSPGATGSQGNGGGVYRRVRRPGQVRYVIRPDWSRAGAVTPEASKYSFRGWSRALSKQLQQRLGVLADGRLGPKSYEALQAFLGAPFVDGEISRQSRTALEVGDGIGPHGWTYTGRASKGSQTIELLQAYVGATVDGVVGPDLVTKLAAKLKDPAAFTTKMPAGTAAPSKKPAASKPAPAKKPAKLDTSKATFDLATGRAFQQYLNRYHGAKLKVDGKVGKKTWMAFQRAVGAPYVDGEISRQSHKASKLGPALTQGWEYTGPGSTGSQTIEKLQAWTGSKVDGVLGPKSIKDLKAKLNTYELP